MGGKVAPDERLRRLACHQPIGRLLRLAACRRGVRPRCVAVASGCTGVRRRGRPHRAAARQAATRRAAARSAFDDVRGRAPSLPRAAARRLPQRPRDVSPGLWLPRDLSRTSCPRAWPCDGRTAMRQRLRRRGTARSAHDTCRVAPGRPADRCGCSRSGRRSRAELGAAAAGRLPARRRAAASTEHGLWLVADRPRLWLLDPETLDVLRVWAPARDRVRGSFAGARRPGPARGLGGFTATSGLARLHWFQPDDAAPSRRRLDLGPRTAADVHAAGARLARRAPSVRRPRTGPGAACGSPRSNDLLQRAGGSRPKLRRSRSCREPRASAYATTAWCGSSARRPPAPYFRSRAVGRWCRPWPAVRRLATSRTGNGRTAAPGRRCRCPAAAQKLDDDPAPTRGAAGRVSDAAISAVPSVSGVSRCSARLRQRGQNFGQLHAVGVVAPVLLGDVVALLAVHARERDLGVNVGALAGQGKSFCWKVSLFLSLGCSGGGTRTRDTTIMSRVL